MEPGEWVLRDAKGFYPCKADIFASTYQEVEVEPRPPRMPMGLHISGRTGPFRFVIGDQDLSALMIAAGEYAVVIENATPDQPNPVLIAWTPILFAGEVNDPEGLTRTGTPASVSGQ